MTVEERKDNTYFDQTGTQILVGDLLRVYHFSMGKRKQYMYHVVIMEETIDFPVMSARSYYNDNSHYRIYAVAKNRIYGDAKIISKRDYDTKRIKTKVL